MKFNEDKSVWVIDSANMQYEDEAILAALYIQHPSISIFKNKTTTGENITYSLFINNDEIHVQLSNTVVIERKAQNGFSGYYGFSNYYVIDDAIQGGGAQAEVKKVIAKGILNGEGVPIPKKVLEESGQVAKLYYESGEISELNALDNCNIDLDHLKLKPILDANNLPCVIMRNLGSGNDLFDLVLDPNSRDFSYKVVALLLALAEAYVEQVSKKGIVHLDLKPENIKSDYYETYGIWKVKIFDYAFSRKIGESVIAYGTPDFMAPEIANPSEGAKLSTSADIYSLGKVFFEILGLISKLSQYSEEHQRLIQFMMALSIQMMNPEPNERPDINAIITELHEIYLEQRIPKESRQAVESACESAKATKVELTKIYTPQHIKKVISEALDNIEDDEFAIKEFIVELNIEALEGCVNESEIRTRINGLIDNFIFYKEQLKKALEDTKKLVQELDVYETLPMLVDTRKKLEIWSHLIERRLMLSEEKYGKSLDRMQIFNRKAVLEMQAVGKILQVANSHKGIKRAYDMGLTIKETDFALIKDLEKIISETVDSFNNADYFLKAFIAGLGFSEYQKLATKEDIFEELKKIAENYSGQVELLGSIIDDIKAKCGQLLKSEENSNYEKDFEQGSKLVMPDKDCFEQIFVFNKKYEENKAGLEYLRELSGHMLDANKRGFLVKKRLNMLSRDEILSDDSIEAIFREHLDEMPYAYDAHVIQNFVLALGIPAFNGLETKEAISNKISELKNKIRNLFQELIAIIDDIKKKCEQLPESKANESYKKIISDNLKLIMPDDTSCFESILDFSENYERNKTCLDRLIISVDCMLNANHRGSLVKQSLDELSLSKILDDDSIEAIFREHLNEMPETVQVIRNFVLTLGIPAFNGLETKQAILGEIPRLKNKIRYLLQELQPIINDIEKNCEQLAESEENKNYKEGINRSLEMVRSDLILNKKYEENKADLECLRELSGNMVDAYKRGSLVKDRLDKLSLNEILQDDCSIEAIFNEQFDKMSSTDTTIVIQNFVLGLGMPVFNGLETKQAILDRLPQLKEEISEKLFKETEAQLQRKINEEVVIFKYRIDEAFSSNSEISFKSVSFESHFTEELNKLVDKPEKAVGKFLKTDLPEGIKKVESSFNAAANRLLSMHKQIKDKLIQANELRQYLPKKSCKLVQKLNELDGKVLSLKNEHHKFVESNVDEIVSLMKDSWKESSIRELETQLESLKNELSVLGTLKGKYLVLKVSKKTEILINKINNNISNSDVGNPDELQNNIWQAVLHYKANTTFLDKLFADYLASKETAKELKIIKKILKIAENKELSDDTKKQDIQTQLNALPPSYFGRHKLKQAIEEIIAPKQPAGEYEPVKKVVSASM